MAGFWDILKKVGTGIIANVVPGGAGMIELANTLLPDDKKLPADATGEQAQNAVMALPPEKRAEIMALEFEVELTEIKESHDTLRTMLTADATSTHTTRPAIARQAFAFSCWFNGFAGGVVLLAYAYAVYKQNATLLTAIVDGWPFVLAVMGAVTGTAAIIVRAYFGVLTKEHEQKVGAATGNFKPSAVASIMQAVGRR